MSRSGLYNPNAFRTMRVCGDASEENRSADAKGWVTRRSTPRPAITGAGDRQSRGPATGNRVGRRPAITWRKGWASVPAKQDGLDGIVGESDTRSKSTKNAPV